MADVEKRDLVQDEKGFRNYGRSNRFRFRRLMMILTSGLIVCALVILGVAYFASDQITVPYKYRGEGNPRDLCGLDYESVIFETPDGLRLSGWFVPGKPDRNNGKTVVLCHGQMANKWNTVPFVPFFYEEGYSMLLFDFRAHGESDGDICTIGFDELKDVQAAVQYLKEEKQAEWIGILGMSMGGSTAILAAANNPAIQAVVADCPFAELKETIYDVCRRDNLPVLGGWLGIQMCRWRFGMMVERVDARQAIGEISPRPILLIQSAHDSVVSREQTQALFDAARDPKELWFVENTGHVQAFQTNEEEYKRRVLAVFSGH